MYSTGAFVLFVALPSVLGAGLSMPHVRRINDVDQPTAPRVTNITYGGSGCPPNSIVLERNSKGEITKVTANETSFLATIGPNVTATENDKACQININVQYEASWKFSPSGADYRGYANLETGVTGQIKSTYYFAGQDKQASDTATFRGPMSGDYLKSDKVDQASTVWSTCGTEGALNINTLVRLSANDKVAKGLITLDFSIDITRFLNNLVWQKCT